MPVILTFDDGVPVHDGAAHEDHPVARDGGGRGVVDVVHLEDDLAVRGHRDAVAVGEGQRLVVVEDRVEVLDPDGVHRTVQHQPDVLTLKTDTGHALRVTYQIVIFLNLSFVRRISLVCR